MVTPALPWRTRNTRIFRGSLMRMKVSTLMITRKKFPRIMSTLRKFMTSTLIFRRC